MDDRRSRFIDLSHPIETGMPVAPRLPSPRIEPLISHEASRPIYGGLAEFEITRLFLAGNSGTSIDSPYHRFRDRADIAGIPLEALVGLPAVCLEGQAVGDDGQDERAGRAIDAVVEPAAIAGRAVLIRTGWSRHWGSEDYWPASPHLAQSLVERVLAGPAALVGVDLANVDDPADLARPVHTALLAAGIPIVENLTGLEALDGLGTALGGPAFRVFAAPLAWRGAAAVPVRVFVEVHDQR